MKISKEKTRPFSIHPGDPESPEGSERDLLRSEAKTGGGQGGAKKRLTSFHLFVKRSGNASNVTMAENMKQPKRINWWCWQKKEGKVCPAPL
jgi:hypothetical protein